MIHAQDWLVILGVFGVAAFVVWICGYLIDAVIAWFSKAPTRDAVQGNVSRLQSVAPSEGDTGHYVPPSLTTKAAKGFAKDGRAAWTWPSNGDAA